MSGYDRITDRTYRNGSLKNILTYSVNETQTSVKVDPDMMDSNFSFECALRANLCGLLYVPKYKV